MADDPIILDSSPFLPDASGTSVDSSFQVIGSQRKLVSASERIEQLNQIDKDITSLLTTASRAISTLSKPSPNQKSAFTQESSTYHEILFSIMSSLKQQLHALEAADITLPASLLSTTTSASNTGSSGVGSSSSGNLGNIGGGTGGLDIGAISGRSDLVGRNMERELWEKAREMILDFDSGSSSGADNEREKVDLRIDGGKS